MTVGTDGVAGGQSAAWGGGPQGVHAMIRVGRRAWLVVVPLLLLAPVVVGLFERCSWGSVWTTATRNTFSTRAECEWATQAAVNDDFLPPMLGKPPCNCRTTDVLMVSLASAAIFGTTVLVRPAFRVALAPGRRVLTQIALVASVLILGVVVFFVLAIVVLVAWRT